MVIRLLRGGLLAAILAAALAPAATAATVLIEGHFTQHFGGRNGELAPCPNGEVICGTGRVQGYGAATDAFIDVDGELLYAFTLADGSSITLAFEFVSAVTPGVSGETHGATMSFGNPVVITLDAFVIGSTGQFAGATGTGTLTLHNVGNVDQITVTLDLDLP
jgi:hypothetical protein